jgi:rhamnose transport system ATP-binding protein
MAETLPVLSGHNISKSFGGVKALQGVEFAAYAGEVHALLGENGAGKSTLIKCFTGVYRPDEGEIQVDGQPTAFADPRDARHAGVAAIYQEPSLFPDLDITENIFVGRQLTAGGGRVAWRQMVQEARGLLARLGVHLDPSTKARYLSVAEQQMVEIARALSINAKILIMDEPTSSLTLAEVAELFRIVRQLRDNGTAVIFISHRLEELFELADRVTILRDGRYVGTQPLANVTTQQLIEMMVGRTLADLFPTQVVAPGGVRLEVENLTRAGLVGAGRTDVAQAIFGVSPATGGVIKIDGKPVKIGDPQTAMALGLAYVPEDRQHHGLLLPMTIAHNITLPDLARFARLGWLDQGEERRSATRAADQMEVKCTSVGQKVNELSGGNQQKVVLAKWLATNPRILILDEPTRGIDVGTKSAVHALMSDLAAQGIAILMISSELPEVLGMSDRILVMREGRLTGHFRRAEATQETIMQAATLGQALAANLHPVPAEVL